MQPKNAPKSSLNSIQRSLLLYKGRWIVFWVSTRALVCFSFRILYHSRYPLTFIPGQDTNNLSEAERVIGMTSDFSLPFCQLKLQMLFNAASGEEVKDRVVDVMFKAAVADSRSNRSNWIGLVALMNQDAVRQVRNITT